MAARPQLQPVGLFSALTALRIHSVRMEGSELSTLVCTQCPRLSYLSLFVELVADSNINIRSDSLQSLRVCIRNPKGLEVVAPRLENLTLPHTIQQAYISAPKLAQLVCRGGCGADDPPLLFPEVGCHLSLLEIGLSSTCLLQLFDEVDVSKLALSVPQGTARYQIFLNETKRLPKCRALSVSLPWSHHGSVPAVLHLLRSCNSTRKLLLNHSFLSSRTCPLSCPCCSEESRRIDGIDLSSLDEVEIISYKNFDEEFELVDLLFRSNAIIKKLVISCKMFGTLETKEVCKKVRILCPPNVKVEFYVFPDGSDGRRVLF